MISLFIIKSRKESYMAKIARISTVEFLQCRYFTELNLYRLIDRWVPSTLDKWMICINWRHLFLRTHLIYGAIPFSRKKHLTVRLRFIFRKKSTHADWKFTVTAVKTTWSWNWNNGIPWLVSEADSNIPLSLHY